MSKKKKVLIILMILICLLGVAYAWFTYYQESGNERAIAADIYLKLNDDTDAINLTKVFPESAEEARSHQTDDNAITFTIDGKNTTDKTVYYEIKLIYGDELASPYERFYDKDLRFDLIEIKNNQEVYLQEAVGYNEINNTKIWVDGVSPNTDTEIERVYKIRMWLAEEVLISDSDPNRDYCATDYCTEYNTINNTHYTCFSTTNECNDKIYYVYQVNTSNLWTYCYELKNNVSLENMINQSLNISTVNKKSSLIKIFIEKWYENNLYNYNNLIDNTIYCNDRTLLTTGANSFENSGWNPNGGDINKTMRFETIGTRYKLTCNRDIDAFNVNNLKAKLEYPVGMLTNDELMFAGKSKSVTSYYLRTGNVYFSLSPYDFTASNARIRYIMTSGSLSGIESNNIRGVRLVISLKSTNEFTQGDGSESNPYVVNTTS